MTDPWKRKEVIGDCTLYLGDCLEVMPMLDPVDAVVTSPPYNQMGAIAKNTPSGMWADSAGGLGFVNRWKDEGYTDAMPEMEYQAMQHRVFSLAAQITKPTGSLFYNHQIRWRDTSLLHPINWFRPDHWRLRSEIIWDRCGAMMFNARMFCRFDERILWFVNSDIWKWNQDCVGYGTVWKIPREQNGAHPVSFPVELPRRCIAATTDPGDVVLDPYSGGASTGVACVKLGRKFIGIELEESYFDIACKRIEKAYAQPDLFIEQEKTPKPIQEELLEAGE